MRPERTDSTAGGGPHRLRATVLLHPPASWESPLESLKSRPLAGRRHLDAATFVQRHGAVAEAAERVRTFADRHDLRIDAIHLPTRSVQISGVVEAFGAALGLSFEQVPHATGIHHHPDREVEVPPELSDWVEAIVGLDERPVFRRPNRLHPLLHEPARPETEEDADADTDEPDTATAPEAKAAPGAATAQLAPRDIPPKVATLYDFPTQQDGHGQTLGIVLLGGGFYPADMEDFFGGSAPEISVVEIDGAANDPAPKDQIDAYLDSLATGSSPDLTPEQIDHVWWTIEATADIQLAASFAPGARIVAYFAPNAAKGKVDAFNHILATEKDQPAVVSCSWGMPEEEAEAPFVKALDRLFQAAAVQGISVCYSAGDSGGDPGPDGKPRAHFPASSPHVLSCGGTTLALEGSDPTTAQVVWNESRGSRVLATGGGLSTVFERPDWQTIEGEDGAGRGLPDVAAKADYRHGYHCRLVGRTILGGGTSVAVPLWAGLLTRLVEAAGHRLGLVAPLLYPEGARETFQDILEGGNGTFDAGPGWDLCTGLGTPNGQALLKVLLSRA